MDVNGQSFPITGSPQTVVLTGLLSDGNPVNVMAGFSDDATADVSILNAFTAPARCNFCTINCLDDMILNLLPGECDIVVNYVITTSGDCLEQPIGFADAYAPANWSEVLINSDGNVDATGAPASIVLTGS